MNNQTSGRNTVLVADHDPVSRSTMMRELHELGFQPIGAQSSYEAIGIAMRERPSVVIIPEIYGADAIYSLRSIAGSYQPRIVMTSPVYRTIRYRRVARQMWEIHGFISKPVLHDDLPEAMGVAPREERQAFARTA